LIITRTLLLSKFDDLTTEQIKLMPNLCQSITLCGLWATFCLNIWSHWHR